MVETEDKKDNFCPILAVHGYHLNERGMAKLMDKASIAEADFIKEICKRCPLKACVLEGEKDEDF